MMDEQPSTNKKRAAKPLLLKQRRVWLGGIAVLGVITCLGVIIVGRLLWATSTWKNYPGAVGALAVDKQGRVWATCQYFCANNNSLRLYADGSEPVEIPLPSELAEERGMSSLTIDNQDRLWVGSWNGAIGMRDINNQWTIFTPEKFTPENSEPIWDIVVDAQGRAWVRSNIGLGVIDPTKNGATYTFTNSGLPTNNASAITIDEKGQLWVANDGAIKVLEPDGNWTTIYHNTGVGSAFAIDRLSQVWRGTHEGVSVLRPDGVWQSYILGDRQVANDIDSIVVDHQNRVWVGAQQGLFRFDPDIGWTTYNTENSSLPEDWVEALAIDQQGRVWVGTDSGLGRLDVGVALSPKSVQIIPLLWSALIPGATVGMLLIIGLIITFTRPGALITYRDFLIGFFGWFVIQGVVVGLVLGGTDWLAHYLMARGEGPALDIVVLCGFPVIILLILGMNIVGLALLFLRKRWMAMGAVSMILVTIATLVWQSF